MTKNTGSQSFRGVVVEVVGHAAQIADEFQRLAPATFGQDLDLNVGDVVRVVNLGSFYRVEEVLPYHTVDRVSHPDPQLPSLWGNVVADSREPSVFNANGRVYVEDGHEDDIEIENWQFDDREAEAAYVSRILLGHGEIPGVHLRDDTIERLSELGIGTENLRRAANEYRRAATVRSELEKKAKESLERQQSMQSKVSELQQTHQQLSERVNEYRGELSKQRKELEILLAGIDEASQIRDALLAEKQGLSEGIQREKEAARKEREALIKEARRDAKKIRDEATKKSTAADARLAEVEAEAEELKNRSLLELREVKQQAAQLRKVLNQEGELSESRKEILNREKYGEADEISALQTALDNLGEARGTGPEQLVALHVGLKHTPFTVLTGPSGSGKTSLVLAYAQQLGIHVTTIAVQPGWRSVQDLHGYVNPLRPGEYRSTPFFEALGFQARQSRSTYLQQVLQGEALGELTKEPGTVPLDLVLLDEINLSQVEYFLADYLSAFELDSRTVALTTPDEAARLALQKGGNEPDDAHALAWLRWLKGQINVPSSFLIAGTANEDHTTMSFSDKFRDRAAFLRVEAPTLERAMLQPRGKNLPGGQHYIPQETWERWCQASSPVAMKPLLEFSNALRQAGLPVSVRLFQRTARIAGDAQRLLEALGVPKADKVAMDVGVSLGIAHKYGQLTEGRTQQRQQQALKQSLEKLLAGRTEATFATLGWDKA